MINKIKPQLSQNQIYSVLSAWNDKIILKSVTEFSEGGFNAVYCIQSNLGKIVLKVAPSDDVSIQASEKGIMYTEYEVYKILSEDKELPLPQLYFSDFSRKIIPFDYLLMECIDGKSLLSIGHRLSENELNKVYFQIGQLNARINEIQNSSFGRLQGKPYKSWFDFFQLMFEQLFEDSNKYRISLPLIKDEFENILFKHKSIFEEVQNPRLVLWDFWEGNILLVKENLEYKISGFFDLERSFWGDPLIEFFFSKNNLSFYSGYQRNSLTKNETCRRLFYNLFQKCNVIMDGKLRGSSNVHGVEWAIREFQTDLNCLKSY